MKMVMVARVAGVLNHIGMIAKTEDRVNRQVSQRPHVARIFNPLAERERPAPTGRNGYLGIERQWPVQTGSTLTGLS